MTNIAVFASGRGTNFKSLIDAQKTGLLPAKIALLIAAKNGIGAIETARAHDIPYHIFQGNSSQGAHQQLFQILKEHQIKFIALAGWLKYIHHDLLEAFPRRIVNIHPALLPFFGGKGMYGMNVHRAVWESGMQVTGATVHFVDEIYDHGPIIIQETVKLEQTDSPKSIANKVLKIEHAIFPKALRIVIEGNFEISGKRFMAKPMEFK